MRRKIAVIDCETDPFKHGRVPKPFIWGYYDGSSYNYFTETRELVDFVRSKRIIIYAHNGGKFDYHFMLDYLSPFTELKIINGRLAQFKIDECEFRDSYSILPIPLKAYQKQEFDYSLLEKIKRKKHMPEIKDYLKSDLINQYSMVKQFVDTYGLNLTLATSAIKAWNRIEKTPSPKTTSRFYNTIFPYYYGGRVECFKKGIIKNKFKVVDINSAYPYAMTFNHPYGDVIFEDIPQGVNEQSFYTIRATSKGAFPIREKNGLSFPNDNVEREYNITGWELKAAIETDTVSNYKIIKKLSLGQSINFKKYVKHFFELKLEAELKGDKAGRLFAKLMLNSLYGKFGANPDNYNKYMIVDQEFIEPCQIEDGYQFNGLLGPWALMQGDLDESEKRYYNVAVSASITGFERAKLWKAICMCSGVLYVDTDCIAATNTSSLNISKDLGAWEIEAECSGGAIAGKKLYAFKKLNGEYKIASKGVRLNAQQIYRVAKGENILYKSEAPTFSYKKEPVFIERNIKIKCA